MLASTIVMFGQQFCGVNAIAYYSSNIFKKATNSDTRALLGSFGFGLLNWVFAYPAFFTIDTFGRRSLLLFTFPFLSLFMLIAGLGFLIPNEQSQLGVVTFGLYMFTVFYVRPLLLLLRLVLTGHVDSLPEWVRLLPLLPPTERGRLTSDGQDRCLSRTLPRSTRSKFVRSAWLSPPRRPGSCAPSVHYESA